ncbi:MAG: hypothetical protein D4R39_00710, partial [Methylophilaceae bacterium]
MKFLSQVRALWLLVIYITVISCPSVAAEVKKVAGKNGDSDLILIKGEIIRGDEKAFKDIALNTESAIVIFNSPGGLLRPALEIGKTIRIKGFSTAVLDSDCTSS